MLDRTTPPATSPFSFHPLPHDTVQVLPNGLSCHTLLGGSQAIGSVSILFPGGREDTANPAVPEIATRTLTEGAGKLSGAEIASSLDFTGARFTPQISGHFCGPGFIVLNSRLTDILPIIRDMIETPAYPPEAIDGIKRTLTAQLKMKQMKVSSRAYQKLLTLVYGAENPGAKEVTEDDIMGIGRNDLFDFHKRAFGTKGAHVYLAGGFDGQALDAMMKLLADIRVNEEGPIPLNSPGMSPAGPQTVYVEMKDAVQTSVCAGIPTIGRSDADYIKLRLTVMGLGGYFGSRLMKNIREDKGLTYHVASFLSADRGNSAVFVEAQCNSDFVDVVVEEISNEMKRMVTNPPGGKELERLKLYAMSQLMENLDSPLTVMSYRVLETVTGTPSDYFERQQHQINSLTSDDISEMAAKYLNPSELRIAIAGPGK